MYLWLLLTNSAYRLYFIAGLNRTTQSIYCESRVDVSGSKQAVYHQWKHTANSDECVEKQRFVAEDLLYQIALSCSLCVEHCAQFWAPLVKAVGSVGHPAEGGPGKDENDGEKAAKRGCECL